MKIFMEGTPVFRNKNIPKAGIGYYTENIYKAMRKLDHANTYTLFGLYFWGRSTDFKTDFSADTKYKLIRYIPGKVWNVANRKGVIPPIDLLMPSRPDVILYTNFRRYSQLGKAKTLVVVHDIAFNIYPSTVNVKNQKYLEKYVPKSIKKADIVVAVSEFTKKEIVKKYKIEPSKVIVTHNAVDQTKFKPTPLSQKIREKYDLPKIYILFMGTIEPRKNIERLVKAYQLLPNELKARYALVLAGGKGWLDEGIEKAIQQVAAPGRVIRPGYIDDGDMPALYSGATVFAFPSLYEGFGIPLLEAMACQTPVLTANNSSLPEVAGDAAVYADALSEDDIARQLAKLLQDAGMQKELVKLGKERVSRFSWEKSAQVILDNINKLVT